MRFLIAALLLLSANAHALVVEENGTVTRSSTVSNTATFFKVDPKRQVVMQVSGTGAGVAKATNVYSSVPTTFNGFFAAAITTTGNDAWTLSAGLSYVGFDVTSGTWIVTVAQPK